MSLKFKTIGLIGKPNHNGAAHTLIQLHQWLCRQELCVFVEKRTAQDLPINSIKTMELTELGKQCDLVIVVGGDGNMLGAARVLARHDVAVIGVNRGNLGFLTDLDPEEFEEPLSRVLAGEYITEQRFLLDVEIHRHGALKSQNTAVNEMVLHPDKVAHMIEFEVHIDGNFMLSQRADGLIISTPTGSTAYSLSGGGPILTPNLNAMTLVPMFPHTLSSRPIVVSSDVEIKLHLSPENEEGIIVSCDSHVSMGVMPGDEIKIKRCNNLLNMVHPKEYNYFNVLRSKLGWGSKLF